MNIRDFLIDNYIYILIVILLSIITVIGFLADKKKSGKKEKPSKNIQDANQMNMENTNQAPMTYQNPSEPMLNNQPMNNQQMNTMNNQMGMMNNGLEQHMNMPNGGDPINQMDNINQTIPQPLPPQDMPNNNGFAGNMMNQQPMMNNPQPVENINPINNQVSEPMYQPLSEQKPVIPPREPMGDIQIPQPLPSQNVPNNNFAGAMMNQPQPMEQNIMPISEPQPINPQPINNMATPTMPQFQSQPIQTEPQMNFGPNPSMNQNMNTNMAMNQPNINTGVMPQPMPAQIQNNGVPSSMPSPQPTTPQPVSFVYGPQQNNNNM